MIEERKDEADEEYEDDDGEYDEDDEDGDEEDLDQGEDAYKVSRCHGNAPKNLLLAPYFTSQLTIGRNRSGREWWRWRSGLLEQT